MTHVFIFAVLHRSIQHLTMLFNISRYLRLLAIFIGLSNPVWASSLESSAFETSIQLNWKFQFEFAGPIAAKEKGFYAQQGLNVVLNEGGPDIDPVESVIKGRSHFGISGSSLIIDRYEGKPVVALATLLQNSAVGLLVRKSAGVKSVFDIQGKRLAIGKDNVDEIQAYLASWGISPDSNEIRTQFYRIQDLEKGQIDGLAVFVSNELYPIRERLNDYLLLTARSRGIELFGNILFTTEDQINQHPEQVEAFRKATIQGWAYALEHPAEIAKIIFDHYNSQHKSLDHLLFEAEKLKELTRIDLVEPGYMNPNRWRYVARFYAQQNKLPIDYNLDGFIYSPDSETVPAWVFYVFAVLGLILVLGGIGAVIYYRQKHRQLIQSDQIIDEISQQLGLMNALVEQLAIPFFVIDIANNWHLVFVNKAACQHFGLPKETLLQMRFADWDPAMTQDELQTLYDILKTEGASQFQTQHLIYQDQKKMVIPIEIAVSYQKHGAKEYAYGYILDIKERIQREKHLTSAKNHAEMMAKSKSDFLANMSHEIRTPMNAIIGLSQLALDQSNQPSVRDYLEKILDSSHTLLNILNDILDFSKLEAGKFSLTPEATRLTSILDSIQILFDHIATEKGLFFNIEIRPDTPDCLICDVLRLKQILTNLVGNAFKFTERGGITIHVKPLRLEDNKADLSFAVTDTGIGISDEGKQKLFQSFTQVDSSSTRRFGGSGLGLVISKNLLNLMHSDLELDSIPGQGSTFRFVLPVQLADPQSCGSERPQPIKIAPGELKSQLYELGRSLQQASILVAEDNRVNQLIVVRFLELAGISVTVVENGNQAVAEVSQGNYAAVLMDVHMPEMDGIAATRKIREIPQFKKLPIIALSAGVTLDEQQNCIDAGMNDFLTKPLEAEQLLNKLLLWVMPKKANYLTLNENQESLTESWHRLQDLTSVFDFKEFGLATQYDGKLLEQVLKAFSSECEQKYNGIVVSLNDSNWQNAIDLLKDLESDVLMLGHRTLPKKSQLLADELRQGATYTESVLNEWQIHYEKTKNLLKDYLAKLNLETTI